MKDYKEAMQQGREFIADNLAQCCKEELEWQNTALLCDGKLREAAAIFNTVDSTHCMPIAQSEVARQAMALAASGGNAAPGLTDEAIHELMSQNVNCDYSEGLAFARAIEAASAPNAALVALKEACDLIRLEVADGVHTEEYRRGMAALSAAGQEVGHG